MRKWRALAVLTLALIAACVLIDELQVQIDGEYQQKPCLFLLRRVSASQYLLSDGCNISGLQSTMAPTPTFLQDVT